MAHTEIMLSPMAGFTDAPMRLISGRFGAARTFTEMVNAAGLARDGEASWALLETLPGEPKPFAHLYGSNPDEFAAAAEKVAATGRFSGIDINAGCPAPKVVREGAGSALMRHPKLVGRIVDKEILVVFGARVVLRTFHFQHDEGRPEALAHAYRQGFARKPAIQPTLETVLGG